MLAPLLLGVQAGSMLGYLGQHALGRYDLPLPTDDEPSLAFVVPNLAAFEEAWSIERRDLRFAVALHEVIHAAERSVPWVRAKLVGLAIEYVSAYEVQPAAFEQFGDIAQVWSSYESRHKQDDAQPFLRGINSFQLCRQNGRWWVRINEDPKEVAAQFKARLAKKA